MFLSILLSANCLVSVANAGLINLLENSGFETGDFTDWIVTGTSPHTDVGIDGTNLSGYTDNDFDPSYSNVRSGEYSAWAIVSATNNLYADFSQTLSVSGNTVYNIGYFFGNDTATAYGWSSFITVNGSTIATPSSYIRGSTSADFADIGGTYTTAANETSLTVRYRINGSGTGRAAFSLDDFYVQTEVTVPEPSTLAIFALGMIGLASRRFKKQS